MVTIKDRLKDKLTDDEIKLLKTSFDIVGDIAQLEIPEELESKEKIIAETVMKLHKNVNVVVKKVGATSGEERIRPVKIIAGENRSKTIHRENNYEFELDLNKVYFTPRLVTERKRVVSQIKEGEIVFDLFAGVGVFSIPCTKKAEKVIAIDINSDAVRYMKENAMRNKVWSKMEIYEGDCRKVVEEKNFENCADRIIMNLPMHSENFLDVAFKIAKKDCVIHFYTFLEESELFEKGIKTIKDSAEKHGKKIEILGNKTCGQLAPRIYRTVIDFKVL